MSLSARRYFQIATSGPLLSACMSTVMLLPLAAVHESAGGSSRHVAPPHDIGRKRGEADMNLIYEVCAQN